MPLTFLAHQAPVLPLKLRWPRAFDGTALAIGSMVPDLVFVTHGTAWYIDAHAVWAQVWFCLPVTVVLTLIAKRAVAGPLGASLPDLGGFHLRDHARIATRPVPQGPWGWLVLGTSALVGSFSHVVFDSFTHGFGWVVENVDWLQTYLFSLPSWATGRRVHVYDVLQIGGTAAGIVVTVATMWAIGRRRLLMGWYPDASIPEPDSASRRLFVIAITVGAAAGIALAFAMRDIGGPQDAVIRFAVTAGVGVLVGAVLVERRTNAP